LREETVRNLTALALASILTNLFHRTAAARSSLRKVIRKLTSTLASLMRTFTREPIDYGSLMSLSNESRLSAIRTMSDLSGRVGSTYSLCSTKSHGSKKSRGRSQSKRSQNKEPKRCSRDHRSKTSSDRKRSPETKRDSYNKRVSMVTMSSESTKLGEIRASRVHGSTHHKVTYPLHTYHSHTRYEEVGGKGKKRWFGLFGGK
jgi:hypothetical protein